MGYNIGPKIGIEGEQQFRKQIRDINAEYKTLEAETRAVTAAFEANGDEQGKLEATARQLQKQIDTQKEKMALLQDAVQKASDKFGENSIEANRLKGALYDTQATVSGLESELKDAQNRLDITGDELEDFSKETDNAGDHVVDFGDLLKANLASDLLMSGLEKAGDFLKDFASGTIETAAEVKAANSQFSQSFGSLEDSARNALKNISDQTNIASTRMQGSYTRIFAFAKTVGAESDAALDIASRAMVAAADSAAYYDKSIEEVTETLQSFLKGNYENDAALGISATEVSRNTKANELYARSFQELSESQKVDVLLAMVEAGNEASGAIGQAARESDSWENVTGELAEAFKQLQAEVGKPALKKLTPIIQKVTDKVYELIDDVDWDEFGDTIEDVADTFLDNGPQIIKTIGSLTAGFVAFKATQKAQELVTVATSFITMGQAATTAGTAVATSGALAAVSPWGLAAVAIGGVVALVTSLAIEAETSVSDLERSTERLQESFSNAEETYTETTTEIEGAAYAAEHYVDRLEELEAAGLDNAAANREYEMTVEKLNELIPDLNLVIDEQTGLVDKNKDAILDDIEAWKKNATLQALQEKYSAQIEAQAKAKAELLDATVRLKNLEEDLPSLQEKLAAKEKEVTAAVEKHTEVNKTDQIEAVKLSLAIQDLRIEQEQLSAAVADNLTEQKALEDEVPVLEATIASYEDEILNAKEAMDLFAQETSDAGDEQTDLDQRVQAVQSSVESLAAAYGEAKESARESIDSQIGLFDELATENEYSAGDIIKNWEDQRKAFSDYNDNLEKAVDMGLDEQLVTQLSDGSEESMQILDALVNDSKIRIADINAEFAKLNAAKNTLSETLAEIEISFDESLKNIVNLARKSGVNALDGLIMGLDVRKWEAHIKKLAESWETYDDEMDINSPSRVAEKSGEFTATGAIIGVDNMISDFERKMSEFADAGRMAYLQNQLDRAESYPDLYSPYLAAPVNNTTRTTNLGGISIQIYTQPGQDEYAIAEIVAEKLQLAVEREENGL